MLKEAESNIIRAALVQGAVRMREQIAINILELARDLGIESFVIDRIIRVVSETKPE